MPAPAITQQRLGVDAYRDATGTLWQTADRVEARRQSMLRVAWRTRIPCSTVSRVTTPMHSGFYDLLLTESSAARVDEVGSKTRGQKFQNAAVDELACLSGCEVRISLDPCKTRLREYAWIFHRNTGFGSA